MIPFFYFHDNWFNVFLFVFVEFHFEFDSKKSGAQDKIRDKVWVGTTSDDIFQDINFIPYSYHNTKSESVKLKL